MCGGKNIFIYTTRDFPHPMNTRSSFSPHESFHEYSHDSSLWILMNHSMNTRSSFSPHESFHEYSHDSSHEYSFHEYSHDSFSPMNTHDSFHEYSWFIPSSHESSENNLPKIVTSQRQPTHLLANQRGGDLNDSEIGVRVFEIFFFGEKPYFEMTHRKY